MIKALIVALIAVLLVHSVAADRLSIPIESLKVYQLIDLWDTVPAEQLSPTGDIIRSFRDASSDYTRQNAFALTPVYADMQNFKGLKKIDPIATQVAQNSFQGVPFNISLWAVQFTNKKYPKYTAQRTQIDIKVPAVDGQHVYTMLLLPVPEESIILKSGVAKTYANGASTVIVYQSNGVDSTIYLTQALTKEQIDSVVSTSFYVQVPAVQEIQPETQAPAVILATLPEQKKNNIAVIIFSLIPVPLLAVGGVWYYKKKRMEDLMLKYGSPRNDVQPTPVEKQEHVWADHIHKLLDHFHKKKS